MLSRNWMLYASGMLLMFSAFVIMLPGNASAGTRSAFPALMQCSDTEPDKDQTNYVYPYIRATGSLTTYLPVVFKSDACVPIPGETYSAISVSSAPTDRPAEEHADLNLALRSYEQTSNTLGLIDLPGETDSKAPQLPGLFQDNRTPTFAHVYRVYDWYWPTNSRGSLLTNPPVTLAGFETTSGEIIRVPSSGYNIGSKLFVPARGVTSEGDGYEVLVLYASSERITLKYTREDNVISGYTIHIEGICVDPNLLALYTYWNDNRRGNLPALYAGQGVGRAVGAEIQVAIRDCGTFMDPRSRKDWWQGR